MLQDTEPKLSGTRGSVLTDPQVSCSSCSLAHLDEPWVSALLQALLLGLVPGLVPELRLRGSGYLWDVLVVVSHFHGHSKPLIASHQLTSLGSKNSHGQAQSQRLGAIICPPWNHGQGVDNLTPLQQSEEITGTNNLLKHPSLCIIHQVGSNFGLHSQCVIMVVLSPYHILYPLAGISKVVCK